MLSRFACLLPILLALLPVVADEVDEIRWEPFHGSGFRDTPMDGELGRIRVPARRDVPTSETIELAFVRFSTSRPDPGPPIPPGPPPGPPPPCSGPWGCFTGPTCRCPSGACEYGPTP